MCGIAGAISTQPIQPGMVEKMTHCLLHRGPDDGGIEHISFAAGEVVLGNRRLSILDLSPAGHMPMQDPVTGNWATYNGEIYNFREVKKDLVSAGDIFTGDSDTEVILKAYARWGMEFLHKLRGMFALALFDRSRQELYLVRDRLGIKPLYYVQDGDTLVFASEVRSLLKSGLVKKQINPVAFHQFLSFGSVYDPETIVEGIHSLRPGYYLVWKNGRAEVRKYWNLASYFSAENPGEAGSVAEVYDRVKSAFTEAVKQHMTSDVPVSLFLSGGIDSSAVAMVLKELGHSGIDSFSIVFKEADHSEAEDARMVAKLAQTRHHEVLISEQDVLRELPTMIAAMDQPSFDGINSYVISKAVKEAGFKVALSGLGGDELFAGYSTFSSVPRLERWQRTARKLPTVLRTPVVAAAGSLLSNRDQQQKLAAILSANGGSVHPYAAMRMMFVPGMTAMLSRGSNNGRAEQAMAPVQETIAEASAMDPVNRVSYLELSNYMRNTLLRDADVMSMASSLEVRVPFIDHVLVERVAGFPGRIKFDPCKPKTLLTTALEGLLPRKIVHKKKQGFMLPFKHWLGGEMRGTMEKVLTGKGSNSKAAVLDGPAVSEVWNSFLAGRTSWTRPWSLFVLQQWCRHNLGQDIL